MLSTKQLKNAVHRPDITRKQQVLLCLAAEPTQPRTVAAVRELAQQAGLRKAKQWNISSVLGSLPGLVISSGGSWELTDAGKDEVASLLGLSSTPTAVSSLRQHLPKISSPDVQAFVEEAIGALEARFYRASVVLSWVGSIAILYDIVLAKHLLAFNTEAVRRDAKWKAATSTDGLAKMKEYDFLQVIEAIGVVGKNVKSELEGCLKLRNGCGHPNSLQIAEHRVNSHIETLVLNVYAPFL